MDMSAPQELALSVGAFVRFRFNNRNKHGRIRAIEHGLVVIYCQRGGHYSVPPSSVTKTFAPDHLFPSRLRRTKI